MKGEIPGGVPGDIPAVGHGDDIAIKEMEPIVITAVPARGGRRGLGGVALEPVLDGVVVELFRPEKAGVGLADDFAFGLGEVIGFPGFVEGVGFRDALIEDFGKRVAEGSF